MSLAPWEPSIGNAGIAASGTGLSAVEALGPDQEVYLRTNRVIIMYRHVEWHSQPVNQGADVHPHVEEMMDMDPGYIHRAEHGDQIVEPVGR